MSVVPVTLAVTIYPKNKTDAPYPATIVGYAWITGLSVGGGPMPPGDKPELPPIEEPPPEHPLEEMFTMVAKEPPPNGGWGWFPEYGWVYSRGEGQSGPKRR